LKLTRDDVIHVAKLARLEINNEEINQYTEQLNSILEYADKLNTLDTLDVAPTAHAVPIKNVFREDQVRPCLGREEALANAPEAEDGMFRVPRVIE
jgi:aspartyl-tRNA(Asn)/glutamyl-tRNA(Gln) amidotransferase subunit C